MAALHHRPEIDDMRSAFDSASCQSDHDSARRSHTTSRSSSDKSYRTAATEYTQHSTKRPARIHYNTYDDKHDGNNDVAPQYFADRQPEHSPRCSVETCASTIASEEDAQDEFPQPDLDVPEYIQQKSGPSAVAATPADFSELFPSHRRLLIRHDDSTPDGNMNLRVDTEVNVRGQRRDMTLYHLRMHELRNREFSLRRYCRDSGREVCHTARKLERQSPTKQRPGFHRSLSNALNSLRSKSDSKSPTVSNLKRNDSGYGSVGSTVDFDGDDRARSASATPRQQSAVSVNSIKLEFSNYAQVELNRAGVKGGKRYEFEYWGVSYSWRRTVRKEGAVSTTSYQLTKAGSDRALAHIISSALTPSQIEDERSLGGWIPPCSMWLADDSIICAQKDVADVVIATGLLSLVDDCIKTHFSTKQKLEFVGPKRLLSEVFRRDTSSQQSRHSSQIHDSRPTSRDTGSTGTRTPARAVSSVI